MKPYLESDKPELKRGDYVYIKSFETVKKDLENYQIHFRWGDKMFKYCGKKAKITNAVPTCEGVRYSLDIDHMFFNWHKTMFDYNKIIRRFVENE